MTRLGASLYKEVIRSAHCGFVVYTLTGKIIETNQAYSRMSGYSRKEMLKMKIHDLRAEPIEIVNQSISNIKKVSHSTFESFHRRKDGGLFEVEVSMKFVRQKKGVIISTVKDISDWKKREKLKEEHTSLLVHDLKAPLTALGISLQLINHALPKPVPHPIDRALKSIEKNGQRLLEMINSILEAAKLEALKINLGKYPINLSELLMEVVIQIPPSEYRDRIRIFCPQEILIMGERDYLKRAVTNLVQNALKYSEDDSFIEVLAKAKGKEALISIKDSGPGISEKDLNHVFDKFFRAQSTEYKPGTGLGLYITRLLVEACGGKISVESKSGEGSTFTVSIPLV